jgi:hypothetical protein
MIVILPSDRKIGLIMERVSLETFSAILSCESSVNGFPVLYQNHDIHGMLCMTTLHWQTHFGSNWFHHDTQSNSGF